MIRIELRLLTIREETWVTVPSPASITRTEVRLLTAGTWARSESLRRVG